MANIIKYKTQNCNYKVDFMLRIQNFVPYKQKKDSIARIFFLNYLRLWQTAHNLIMFILKFLKLQTQSHQQEPALQRYPQPIYLISLELSEI